MKSAGKTGVVHTRLVDQLLMTSSAGGTFYNAVALYTDVVSLGEFTDFTNVFDEFKVTSVRCTYIPLTPYKVEALTNTNGRVMCWAFDTTDSSTPSSISPEPTL